MKDEHKKQIDELIAKAAKADKSEDAIRFSQAACNAANAAFLVGPVKETSAT